jgi:hypothetical protein
MVVLLQVAVQETALVKTITCKNQTPCQTHFIMAAGPPCSMSDMMDASSGSSFSCCSFVSMLSRNCGFCMPCIICIIAGSCCMSRKMAVCQTPATATELLAYAAAG